jgi:hypothetical protein
MAYNRDRLNNAQSVILDRSERSQGRVALALMLALPLDSSSSAKGGLLENDSIRQTQGYAPTLLLTQGTRYRLRVYLLILQQRQPVLQILQCRQN